MDIEKIKAEARKEIKEEDFRKAVDEYKAKLRSRKTIWDKIFPYKLMIVKKEKL